MNYTPLNIKTDYSLLNSMIKIPDLITYAKENHIASLTITDDNLCGAIEFYNACINSNIKPIIGLDILISNYHLLLYAKNIKGYQNLLQISTTISEEKLTLSFLQQFSSDLICIIPYESLTLAQNINFYETIYFGYHTIEEYHELGEVSKIYCHSIRYLKKEDQIYFQYLKKIANQDSNLEPEYLILPKDIPFDFNTNYEFTNLCNIEIPSSQKRIPKFPCPDGYTSQEYLKYLCKEGLKSIFGNMVPSKYIERLKYELSVIEQMDFCDYFLIVWDYVKFAKEHHILVGPGRGSSAASLVSYCLNIIEIDPLKYHLLFERFLNKDRVTMPDIDIDFDGERKIEVIEYCKQKYGIKNVAGVITFNCLTTKQVLKDVGKILEIPTEMLDYFVRMFQSKLGIEQNLKKSDRIKNHLTKNPELKKVVEISLKLENLKKHISSHASGVVMCDSNITSIAPLVKCNQEYLVGYTMDFLEQLGLIKMDFLSLTTLTAINHILSEIEGPIWNQIPMDDAKTFELLKNGQTMGIFQLESNGMIQLLKRAKIHEFDELYNIIALYRPGPIQNIDLYIKRKNGQEPIEYLHPDLVPILKSTYGIIIYQEQIMQIAVTFAHYSLGRADILRRAMAKKKEDILLKEKPYFMEQIQKSGYDLEFAEKIYDMILKFAEYGFPKAHAVTYSLISYRMAYLKANYPEIFMKNMLNSVIGCDNETKDYISECQELNLTIIPPDINQSSNQYKIISGHLLFPISGIKRIDFGIANSILKERSKKPFQDIYDFMQRTNRKVVDESVLKNLIYSGALDSFQLTRKTMIENLDTLINYVELLDGVSDESILKPDLILYDEYPKNELLYYEKASLGFYLTSHPVSEYRKKYNCPISISSISNYLNRVIDLIVSIESIRETRTKTGELICFLRVSDQVLKLEAPIFAATYKQIPDISVNDIIKITGRVGRRDGKDQIIVNKIQILEHIDQYNLS